MSGEGGNFTPMKINESLLVLMAWCGVTGLLAQPPAPPASAAWLERSARMSREAEAKGLAEPFRGITAKGQVEPGLFPVRATGVTTEPVRAAAAAWLSLLSAEQRKTAVFPVGDDEWRKWMNQHFYRRQGVSFQAMDEAQRAAAFGLMKAALSAKGLTLAQDIMKLNHTLGELSGGDFVQYGEQLYWITVMGEPSATQPWGFQVDGHHLILNYFVLGDQVVMSPAFYGSEPVVAPSGRYAGLAILQKEQAMGFALLQSLDAGQRAKAVLATAKPGNNALTEAFKDNVVLDYAGVRATELSAEQREQLVALIGVFVANLADGQAKVKMAEVRAKLDATHFAWIGGTEAGGVFYFRIHSPVVLVEFDHQRPANLKHLAKDPQAPNRQHIHVVVRTPNGNDYGKDLLRQHLLAQPH
jgi:hypothetical protein